MKTERTSLKVWHGEEESTFTGGPRHLELVEEVSELLTHSHGPQEPFIVEEMILTPLRALLMLRNTHQHIFKSSQTAS